MATCAAGVSAQSLVPSGDPVTADAAIVQPANNGPVYRNVSLPPANLERTPTNTPASIPRPTGAVKERALIREIIDPEVLMKIEPSQSKIIRTNFAIVRTAVQDPDVVDVQAFGSNEFEIYGKAVGETTVTFWYELPNGQVDFLRYLVEVDDEGQQQRRREKKFKRLQSRINELFPDSQVLLVPVGDKVIVRGQARDSKEATEILRMLGNGAGVRRGGQGGGFDQNAGLGNPWGIGGGGGFGSGGRQVGWPFGVPQPGAGNAIVDPDQEDLTASLGVQFINLLRVPGVQQVMLKVRVAELVRNSARSAGADITIDSGSVNISNLLSGGGNLSVILSDGDVSFFLTAVATHGYGKILAEPTLVTISGKPAQFLAGGEFAVPTAVGLGGIGAASTAFRGFGTELSFTPTVVDKDLVRLEVAPSFSTINNDATVAGIPGLNRRSVNTTVDLREGQWLAIAGLIQDEQSGQKTRLPYLGDLPFIGNLFTSRDTARFETELVVLVSPQLVHPLESDQVPSLLPGMEVTDPTDDDFFLRGQTEGYRSADFRSTVWNEIQTQGRGIREQNYLDIMRARIRRKIRADKAYVVGPCGFSE